MVVSWMSGVQRSCLWGGSYVNLLSLRVRPLALEYVLLALSQVRLFDRVVVWGLWGWVGGVVGCVSAGSLAASGATELMNLR